MLYIHDIMKLFTSDYSMGIQYSLRVAQGVYITFPTGYIHYNNIFTREYIRLVAIYGIYNHGGQGTHF